MTGEASVSKTFAPETETELIFLVTELTRTENAEAAGTFDARLRL
jgi:hypothetical protein